MTGGFAYANGRVSACESTLLDGRIWQMLLTADDANDVIRLLGDTWYGAFMQYRSMEECFVRAMEATEDELIELSEDPGLVRGILHRRDVRNARYLWKEILFENDGEDIETENPGLVAPDVLRKAPVSEEAKEELPPLFRRTLEELQTSGLENTAEFDRFMDLLAAEVESRELKRISPEFGNFVSTRIELKNFLNAARCSVEGLESREIEDILLPGGFHSPGEISEACRKNALKELLAETPGLEGIASVLGEALERGSFLPLERETDRRLLEMLREGSFPVFGPTPLASLVVRREMEIGHIRLLLAAKSAGVSDDRIRQRLPRG